MLHDHKLVREIHESTLDLPPVLAPGDFEMAEEIIHENLLRLVAANFGISIVPASSQLLRNTGVAYRQLQEVTLTFDLALAWLSGNDSPVLHSNEFWTISLCKNLPHLHIASRESYPWGRSLMMQCALRCAQFAITMTQNDQEA